MSWKGNQRHSIQFPDLYMRLAGESVQGVHCNSDGFTYQKSRGERFVLERKRHKANLDRIFRKSLPLVWRMGTDKFNAEPWIIVMCYFPDNREQSEVDARRVTNGEGVFSGWLESGGRSDRLFGVRQGPARLIYKRIACIGYADLPMVASKELHTQVCLQILDLLAQGGLRYSFAQGRPTEMQFFSDSNDIAKKPKFDARVH